MQRVSRSHFQACPKAAPRGRHATILCIDDDRSALTLRKTVLEHAGYRVLTAETGCFALEMAKTKRIDLALVDLDMPEMGGYCVAALLRCTCPGARIVIFSGHDCREVRQLRDELDGCIAKGTSVPKFLKQVARYVAQSVRTSPTVG